MRWSALIFPVLLGQCVHSSTPTMLSPIRPEPIEISATPVDLYPGFPALKRDGALTYLGGWQLQGDATAFGGLSSLRIDGDDLIALSDAGGLVRFRVGRFGHVSDGRIMPLPAGCGGGRDKTDRDTESLDRDPATGMTWIGFEWRNAICRMNGDFSVADRMIAPPQMAHWVRRSGPETLLRLADGRFMVMAESARNGSHPVLLFASDPTNPDASPLTLSYVAPDGFDPTDAAQLPDGRVLVLNRRFALGSLFTACLTLIDPRAARDGAVLRGPVVARFETPAITENFEGIAIGSEGGNPVVWILSDDNFMSWQRTLLLKFAIR